MTPFNQGIIVGEGPMKTQTKKPFTWYVTATTPVGVDRPQAEYLHNKLRERVHPNPNADYTKWNPAKKVKR